MLLPASLLLGTGAQAGAQEDHAHMDMPAQAPARRRSSRSRWSDPASWPDGKVPGAGDAVTIGRDRDIVLDVSPPALRSLTINGKLSFSDDRDLDLTTEWIYLPGGELDIGSEAKPYTHKATITLTDNVPNEDINTMGDRGIMMLGGTLSLHGDRTNSWTKLAKTAKAGSTKIDVLNAAGWRKGDVIVLASTDFDPHQAEERTITAISGNALTLDKPLKYMHFGEITYRRRRARRGRPADAATSRSRRRRTRRRPTSAATSWRWPGRRCMSRASSSIAWARTCIWPATRSTGTSSAKAEGQYIQNSSIHDTYSRCVTVHGTNDVRVENNVTYNTVGHCFFLEDAVETGNQFVHNLGILTKCHPDGKPCVPTNLGRSRLAAARISSRPARTPRTS